MKNRFKKRDKFGRFSSKELSEDDIKNFKIWNKGLKGIHLSPKSEFKKGQHPSPKTEFKKGQIPWSKGKKGIHFSPNTEFTSERMKGNKHPNWQGDNVGYYGVHIWLKKELGKSKVCRNRINNFLPFECSGKSNTYHWANISRKYKRIKNDWIELCISCHLKADRRKIKLCQ